jgi:DNA-binding XRE family transcriptional regulator
MARRSKKTPKVVGVSHAEVMARELKSPTFRFGYEQRGTVAEIALAVRAMRKQAGMTQVELAKLVAVSQPMIARVEKGMGMRPPGWDLLRKISIALGKQMRLSFVDANDAADRHLVYVNGKPPRVEGGQATGRLDARA